MTPAPKRGWLVWLIATIGISVCVLCAWGAIMLQKFADALGITLGELVR